jgi:hypothetical protein
MPVSSRTDGAGVLPSFDGSRPRSPHTAERSGAVAVMAEHV